MRPTFPGVEIPFAWVRVNDNQAFVSGRAAPFGIAEGRVTDKRQDRFALARQIPRHPAGELGETATYSQRTSAWPLSLGSRATASRYLPVKKSNGTTQSRPTQ